MTGKMKVFTTMAVSALVCALLSLMPTTAGAVTTNLTDGASINLATVIDNSLSVQVDDKVFGDFSFLYQDLNGGSEVTLASSNVNVVALVNGDGFGLEFDQPLIAVNTEINDIVFKYSASVVTNSSNLISDIHLAITGSANNGGIGTVGENVFSNGFGGDVIGHIEADVPGPSSSQTNLDADVSKVWVTKDVLVNGGFSGPTSFATISVIDQTFSQVPEPSTVFLVGMGLFGLVALNRKRRS